MLFRSIKEGVHYFSLPGVPHEMKWLIETKVIPLLQKKFKTDYILHKTLLTAGLGESFLSELIAPFENALPSSIKLAYLPNFGMVRLRLTGTGKDENALEKLMQTQFEKLQEAVKDYLVTNADEPMEMVVGNLLKQRNQTVATAESCTGGFIGHLLSKHAGSSKFYTGEIGRAHV